MTNKTFGFFDQYVRMVENPPFSKETINREIEIVNQSADVLIWSPNRLFSFDLVIPKTVYKPREDTDLLAKRLIQLGNGKGRKFLEIGSGSGALSVLASSLDWEVFACDINPFAVSATRGNLEANKQRGCVVEGGVGPESFPFKEKFDLIVWNLPYISLDEQQQFLGPLEDAAMLDTDEIGLDTRFVNTIMCNDLLTKDGRALMLIDLTNLKSSYPLSHRIWDTHQFQDGETIGIICLWHPFSDKKTKFLERTTSTNNDLMSESLETSHIYAASQTMGKGRNGRLWYSTDKSYAGSWVIPNEFSSVPGAIQLSAAYAVVSALNNPNLSIKWPNDIILNGRKLGGILTESQSNSIDTKIVLGIGLNISHDGDFSDFKYSNISEISDIDMHELDNKLNTGISSLFEVKEGLPSPDLDFSLGQVYTLIKNFGVPIYEGELYPNFAISAEGELLLGELSITDLDSIEWIQSSNKASSGS